MRRTLSKNIKVGSSLGSLTTSFIEATGISDGVIIEALDIMENGLVINGLISKMVALYPFVGGTANTHKYNFMDARDLNEAFRINFGGGSHSSNGFQGSNPVTESSTFFNCTMLPQNDIHFSFYSRTDVETTQVELTNAPSSTSQIVMKYGPTTGHISRLNTTYVGISFKPLRSDYFGTTSRLDQLITKNYADGTLRETVSKESTAPSDKPILFRSDKECAFCSIGYGLTDIQVGTLSNIVQQFNTNLGRSIPQTEV